MNCFDSLTKVVAKECVADSADGVNGSNLEDIITNVFREMDQIDDEDVDVYQEKRAFILALAAFFSGFINAGTPEPLQGKIEAADMLEAVNQAKFALLEKKLVERLLAIPPELDEIKAYLNSTEYFYWNYYLQIADILQAGSELSDQQNRLLNEIRDFCKDMENKYADSMPYWIRSVYSDFTKFNVRYKS